MSNDEMRWDDEMNDILVMMRWWEQWWEMSKNKMSDDKMSVFK